MNRMRSTLLSLVLLFGLAAAASTQDAEPTAPGYRLGPNDVISIDVFGSDDLDQKVRILADGTVSLPLIGRVELDGLPLDRAEARIERILRERDLVLEPEVSIFIEEYRSQSVSIQGAVQRPGVYQMIERMTLLDLLGEAGGLAGNANQRAMPTIHVIRRSGASDERLSVDASRLVDDGDTSLDLELRPGDRVIVPQERVYRIYVNGAVHRPGTVEYFASQGITALQALTAAGGPTERAGLSRVYVIRRAADGSEERTEVNLKKVKRGKESDIDLEPNDTLVVPEWFF